MDAGGIDPEKEHWVGVIRAIEDLLPYYERINRVATLGLLPAWRARVAEHSTRMGEVLEIGPGPGSFSRLLHGRVTCLDASTRVLAYARDELDGGRSRCASGLAERLPFKSNVFDGVFCSFAFRDFIDRRAALAEVLRVLRPGAEVHILDIAPPQNGLRRELLGAWIEKGVPLLAAVLTPANVRRTWGSNPYWHFTETYKAMPPPGDHARTMVGLGYESVRWEHLGAEAVFHLTGVKPRTT